MQDNFLEKAHLTAVAELRLTDLERHVDIDDAGVVTVVEGENHVAFPIARIFTIRAPIGTIRGMHAHRRCAQFIICARGAVNIVCDDATERKSFLLDRDDVGLLVPPAVWAVEKFCCDNSLLIVVCNRRYEADDYIRDYAEFRTWRRANNAPTDGNLII